MKNRIYIVFIIILEIINNNYGNNNNYLYTTKGTEINEIKKEIESDKFVVGASYLLSFTKAQYLIELIDGYENKTIYNNGVTFVVGGKVKNQLIAFNIGITVPNNMLLSNENNNIRISYKRQIIGFDLKWYYERLKLNKILLAPGLNIGVSGIDDEIRIINLYDDEKQNISFYGIFGFHLKIQMGFKMYFFFLEYQFKYVPDNNILQGKGGYSEERTKVINLVNLGILFYFDSY